MRISDDRYSRDRQRFDIALLFIRHAARTHTSRAWTGLSDDRIRKLYRSYLCDCQGTPLTRHRGKSPQQVAFFMRTAPPPQEGGALGEPVPPARRPAARPGAGAGAFAAVPGARRTAVSGLRGISRADTRGVDFVRARGVPAHDTGAGR